MHVLLEKLAAEIKQHRLTGRRLLLAVSGGADSVALLRGCLALRSPAVPKKPGFCDRPEQTLDLHVAHLNHQLRGDASRADAEWVRATCEVLSVPVTIGEIDVAAEARQTGIGIEEAARAARYRFLKETARRYGYTEIAVAHTADDQVETIFHHILRGTGLTGLRGMPAARELGDGLQLVRPLLTVSRVEVLDYLASLAQEYRDDASNADETYTRNKIRRQLLPQLTAEYNPHLRGALLRLGQQAAEVQQTISTLAGELLNEALDHCSPDECTLHWKRLLGHPKHIVREAFSQLWRKQGWPRQKMDFDHWDRLVETAWHGRATTLPGNIAAHREGLLVLLRRQGKI